MQDAIDKILENQKVRLTPRAKQLLLLVFDGLLNEPIRWEESATPGSEWEKRTKLINEILVRLPGLLGEWPRKKAPGIDRDFITLFDLLHNFESRQKMFFPGFPGKL